jgi:hypothetical protein
MRKEQPPRLAALSALGLALALTAAAPVASAQDTKAPTGASVTVQTPATLPAQEQEEMADAQPAYEPLRVGDATQGLLAWQRSGEISSATPRAIAGAVANRSYERYLKSFEFPIPERMSSIVKSSGGGGSGAGAPK